MIQKEFKNEYWIIIIEATLSELIKLNAFSFRYNYHQRLYISVLLAYLRCDLKELESLNSQIENEILQQMSGSLNKNDQFDIYVIGKLCLSRLEIRNSDCRDETFDRLSIDEALSDIWRGELCFVKALVCGRLSRLEEQQSFYREASYYYEVAGAHKKSLKSLHNSFAVEGYLRPEKRQTLEYGMIIEKALSLNYLELAGVASLDLSRELQVIGAKALALEYANNSITYLSDARGTVQYGLALCHRAQLYAELDRYVDFDRDIEEANLYGFPEVQAAVGHLRNCFLGDESLEQQPREALSWRNRNIKGPYRNLNLGEYEQKLISFLALRPADTHAIISYLFDTELNKLSYDTLVNRFKNLLTRVRKKAPNLIVREQGLYCLSGVTLNRYF